MEILGLTERSTVHRPSLFSELWTTARILPLLETEIPLMTPLHGNSKTSSNLHFFGDRNFNLWILMNPSFAADIRISEFGMVVRAEIQFCLCAFANLSVGLVLFIAQRQTDPSSLPVAKVYWFNPVTQSVIRLLLLFIIGAKRLIQWRSKCFVPWHT